MDPRPQEPQPQTDKREGLCPSRLGILLAAYLAVRILFANVWALLAPAPIAHVGNDVVEVAMFVLIALMIVACRRRLASHHVDFPAILGFVVSGTLLRTSTQANGLYALAAYVPFVVGAAWLVYRLRRERIAWAAPPWPLASRLLSGVLCGLVLAGLAAWFAAIARGDVPGWKESWSFPVAPLFAAFVHFMGHSAILEEPVFRGFLWGYLRGRDVSDTRIWLLQAGLFLLAHVRLVGRSTTFWITVPAASLLFGLLAWKSRSVTPSLVAHAVYNSLGVVG